MSSVSAVMLEQLSEKLLEMGFDTRVEKEYVPQGEDVAVPALVTGTPLRYLVLGIAIGQLMQNDQSEWYYFTLTKSLPLERNENYGDYDIAYF